MMNTYFKLNNGEQSLVYQIIEAIAKYNKPHTITKAIENVISNYMDSDRTVSVKKCWFGYEIHYDCPTQEWVSHLSNTMLTLQNFATDRGGKFISKAKYNMIDYYDGNTMNYISQMSGIMHRCICVVGSTHAIQVL